MIYEESYPVVIITPDRDRYNLNSPVNMDILVINGGEKLKFPYVEMEIYTPDFSSIHSEIIDLGEMEPLEKSQLSERFVIPLNAPSGYYTATARFREGFTVLSEVTSTFYVAGAATGLPGGIDMIIVLVVAVSLFYFIGKRFKGLKANIAENDGSAGRR